MPGVRHLAAAALLALLLRVVSADRQDASNFFAEFDGLQTNASPEVRSALELLRLKNFGRRPPPSPESRRYSKPGLFPQLPKPGPGQAQQANPVQYSGREHAIHQDLRRRQGVVESDRVSGVSVERFAENIQNQDQRFHTRPRLRPDLPSQERAIQRSHDVFYNQNPHENEELQRFRQRLVLGNPLTGQDKLDEDNKSLKKNQESDRNNDYIPNSREKTNNRNTRVRPENREVVIQRSAETFLTDREDQPFLNNKAEYRQLESFNGPQQNQQIPNTPNEAYTTKIGKSQVSHRNQEDIRSNVERGPRISAETFLTNGDDLNLHHQKFQQQERQNHERPLAYSDVNDPADNERNYQRNEYKNAEISSRISADTFLADQDDPYLRRDKSRSQEIKNPRSHERQSGRTGDEDFLNERRMYQQHEGGPPASNTERSSRLSADTFLTDHDDQLVPRQKSRSQENQNVANHERASARSGDHDLDNKNLIKESSRLQNDGRTVAALERSSKGSSETFLTDKDDPFLDRDYILKLRSKSVKEPDAQINSPTRSAETFLTDEDDKKYFPSKQQSSQEGETTPSRSDDRFLIDNEEFLERPQFRPFSSKRRPYSEEKLPPRSSETFLTDEDDPPGLGSRRPLQPIRSSGERDNSSPPSEESFLTDDDLLQPKKETYRPATISSPSSEENNIVDSDNFLTDEVPHPIPAPQSIPRRKPTPPSHLGRVRWPLPKSAESDESNAQEEHDFKPLFYGDVKYLQPEYDSEERRREQSRRKDYEINGDPHDSPEAQRETERGQQEEGRRQITNKKPEAFDEERPPIYDDHHPLLDFEESSEKHQPLLSPSRNPTSDPERNSERQDNPEEEDAEEVEEEEGVGHEHASKESDEAFPGDGDNESQEEHENSPLIELDSEEAPPHGSRESSEAHDGHNDHELGEVPSPDHSREESPPHPEHSQEEEPHPNQSPEEHHPPSHDDSNEEPPSANNVDSDEHSEDGHVEGGGPPHSEEEEEEGGHSEEEGGEKPPPDYDERPPDYESMKPTPEYEDGGSHSEEESSEGGGEEGSEEEEPDYGGGPSEEEPDYPEGPKPPAKKRPPADFEGQGSAEGGDEDGSPEFNFESFEFPDVMEPPPSSENEGPTRRPPASHRPTSLPEDCPDGDETATRSPLDMLKAKRPTNTARPLPRPGDEVSITVSGPKAVKVRTTKGSTTTTTPRPVTISALGVVKPGGEIIAKVVQPTSPTTSPTTTRQPVATLRSARLRPGLQFGAKVKAKQKDSSSSSTTTVKPSEPWKSVLAAREATALTYLKPPPVGQPQTWLQASPPPTPVFRLFVV